MPDRYAAFMKCIAFAANALAVGFATFSPVDALADLPTPVASVSGTAYEKSPSTRAHSGPATLDTGALKLIVSAPGIVPVLGASPAPVSVAAGDGLVSLYNLEVEPLAIHVPPAFLKKLGKPLAVSCSIQRGGQLVGHTDYPITVPASGSLDSNFNEHVARLSGMAAVPVDHANCHLTVGTGNTYELLSSYLKTGPGMAALQGFTLEPQSALDNVIDVK